MKGSGVAVGRRGEVHLVDHLGSLTDGAVILHPDLVIGSFGIHGAPVGGGQPDLVAGLQLEGGLATDAGEVVMVPELGGRIGGFSWGVSFGPLIYADGR